mmetsp:Transcript_66455/g.144292  ORF Transcript_66455/g.144292 Transcript_66455/m.144292 type:complete len:225 (-) Transcript_66455:448-1122(-)
MQPLLLSLLLLAMLMSLLRRPRPCLKLLLLTLLLPVTRWLWLTSKWSQLWPIQPRQSRQSRQRTLDHWRPREVPRSLLRRAALQIQVFPSTSPMPPLTSTPRAELVPLGTSQMPLWTWSSRAALWTWRTQSQLQQLEESQNVQKCSPKVQKIQEPQAKSQPPTSQMPRWQSQISLQRSRVSLWTPRLPLQQSQKCPQMLRRPPSIPSVVKVWPSMRPWTGRQRW